MRNNFSSLVKQEMVNRFESVIKDEILANDRNIASTNKSLEQMRKDIDSLKSEYEARKNSNQDLYNRLSAQFSSEIDAVEKKLKEHFESTAKNLESFSHVTASFSDKINGYISKESNEILKVEEKKRVDDQVDSLRKHLNEAQLTFERLHEDLLEKNSEFYRQVFHDQDKLLNKISEIDAKFEAYKVEFAGILKEIRIYKRENFISHKEIEKLYILIDRLEKRIEK